MIEYIAFNTLRNFISKDMQLTQEINNLMLQREMIIAKHHTGVDTSNGYYSYSSLRIETAVISIIEAEESHKKTFKQHYEMRRQINRMMKETLTNEEKEAYKAHVRAEPTSLSEDEIINMMNNQIATKLCKYIIENDL